MTKTMTQSVTQSTTQIMTDPMTQPVPQPTRGRPARRRAALLATLALLGVAGASMSATSPTLQGEAHMTTDQAVRETLSAYQTALNAADVPAIIRLYTEDAVFMPSEGPTAEGREAVEGTYTHILGMINLSIEFQIDSIELYDDIAIARTISRGEVTVLANNTKAPEQNRELFVLKRSADRWLIHRYMFNKMSPAEG